MRVGTIKEIKNNENRVGLTPVGVKTLVEHGHEIFVQEHSGEGAGFTDEEYIGAGAKMVSNPEEVVDQVELLVKVKEPLPREYELLERFKGKTLFTYLHLSGVEKSLTEKLIETGVTGIAYETVEDQNGRLPLLAPMSEIAGVLAIQYGAEYLQKKHGGRGVTLGFIHNTDLAHTVVVGGGFVGTTSAKTVAGMGGLVTIFDVRPERVEQLKKELREHLGETLYKNVTVLVSEPKIFAEKIKEADLLVGAVLVPGTKAPQVVTETHVKSMKKGAVIVDVSIDQGGCVWGSHATTHSEPIYDIEGKIYCCVANMPGQVPRQSTQALTAATLPYVLRMADKGIMTSIWESLMGDGRFAKGVNTFAGKIAFSPVAKDLNLESYYADLKGLIEEALKKFGTAKIPLSA